MIVPASRSELLKSIARETARMSYPGSMSRGEKQVVTKGTKEKLETYFATTFPMEEVWSSAKTLTGSYEKWHKKRTAEIASALGDHVANQNVPSSVAAKFLNTFMYQLMKYEPCRPLLPVLHLPLDRHVFDALHRLKSPALKSVSSAFESSPYALSYKDYSEIQCALLLFIEELNKRQKIEYKVKFRIELNWLWL